MLFNTSVYIVCTCVHKHVGSRGEPVRLHAMLNTYAQSSGYQINQIQAGPIRELSRAHTQTYTENPCTNSYIANAKQCINIHPAFFCATIDFQISYIFT